jgi:hypothetical protein
MGCCAPQLPYMERLAQIEERMYELASIPKEYTKKEFVTVNMKDGTSHKIWTVIIDLPDTPEP